MRADHARIMRGPSDELGEEYMAIIDAYDDPYILKDLQTFDKQFGLADPVFTKAMPNGTPAFTRFKAESNSAIKGPLPRATNRSRAAVSDSPADTANANSSAA